MATPRYLFTTSRRPSPRLRTFVKELAAVFPNAVRVNRGKKSLTELYSDAMSLNAARIIIIEQKKGNPGAIRIFDVNEPESRPVTLIISNVRLLRETPGGATPYNVKSVALEIPSEPAIEGYVETFMKAFMLNPAMEGKHYDVIVKLSATKSGNARVDFINPNTGKIVGPSFIIRKCLVGVQ